MTCFHALTMLMWIRTRDLDLGSADVDATGHERQASRVSRSGFNRICNHCSAEAEVVLGDRQVDEPVLWRSLFCRHLQAAKHD